MNRQTNFTGYSRGYAWGTFFEGLQHGHLSAYLLLFGMVALGSVFLWAGSNMMRKETRR